jgi:hypothetical protein
MAMGLRIDQRSSDVVDLNRHRERLQYAALAITSGDALRWATEAPRARHHDEPKEHYREHVTDPAKQAIDTFVTRVRIEANRMLTRASEAFRDAWKWI